MQTMRPDSPAQPVHDPIIPRRPRRFSAFRSALIDYEQTLDWIDAMVAGRERGYVCVCNVHTVMASHEDPELRAALHGARRSTYPMASRSCGR